MLRRDPVRAARRATGGAALLSCETPRGSSPEIGLQVSPGMVLVVIGLALAALGLVGMTGLLDWFGHLPGDIRIERGSTRIYIPITSLIIVSAVLTLIVQILARFFR